MPTDSTLEKKERKSTYTYTSIFLFFSFHSFIHESSLSSSFSSLSRLSGMGTSLSIFHHQQNKKKEPPDCILQSEIRETEEEDDDERTTREQQAIFMHRYEPRDKSSLLLLFSLWVLFFLLELKASYQESQELFHSSSSCEE